MDLATVIGIVVAVGAILGGQILEGGHVSSIMQPTAAIIVLGGTFGAVAVQFPGGALKRALSDIKQVFLPESQTPGKILESIISLANKARREGLVAIERDVAALDNKFLQRALEMAVDGTEARSLRGALEIELTHAEEEGESSAKVFEALGGYSPTIGIIGAVLGLIHVMENLSDPGKLGSGIAVAFVATVYGVALANLFFLPMAGKLKTRHREKMVTMELVIEGACSIAEGENPRVIERKLAVYAGHRAEGATPEEAGSAAAQAAKA